MESNQIILPCQSSTVTTLGKSLGILVSPGLRWDEKKMFMLQSALAYQLLGKWQPRLYQVALLLVALTVPFTMEKLRSEGVSYTQSP